MAYDLPYLYGFFAKKIEQVDSMTKARKDHYSDISSRSRSGGRRTVKRVTSTQLAEKMLRGESLV